MTDKDKIAIIGIGCRFPGGVRDTETFWDLLKNGVDAITEVPPDRFDISDFYDPRPQIPGKIVTRYGGFIDDVDKFDANFFGISPREAVNLDPQQRLLAEVTYEAFQDAGIDHNDSVRFKTGVYVGIFSNDYEISMFESFQHISFYSATGGAHYSASGRLSYLFDLKGPSLTVETACSSSLVAVHLACQSLRNNESEIAVAGGVNLILTPHMSIALSSGMVLSPEGRCKFGDVSANGYARSEGCGIVVLKLLSKALIDNDRIYAVILGSAINNDGHDGLLVAPSINGQISVQQDAYRDAGVDPSKVTFIEAHGTGTAIGDPVEMKALGKVIGVHRSQENPCLVGSVKTNIGHGETASGVAGLIKAALCLQHRQIPPSLHFKVPNPEIPWDELNMRMVTEQTDIPVMDRPIIAGVNSFGLTGMNAHIVLQEFPAKTKDAPPKACMSSDTNRPYLLPLSAKSPESLSEMLGRWQQFLSAEDTKSAASIHDICYSASQRRTHHEYRLSVVGQSKAELCEKLSGLQGAAQSSAADRMGSDGSTRGGLAFVFSGQGPQWFAMGRVLLEREPVFRESIECISRLLKSHSNWSLIDEMRADEASSKIDQTEVAQPALFALQMALAALWESWGIRPDAVVGHSIGEVAAACYSGVLSLDDAVRVVYHRGRLLQKAAGQGRMAAVEISPEEAETIIAKYANRLSIAAFNSPTSVTLSGEPEALGEVLEALKRRNHSFRMLAVNYAFHSHQVEPYQLEMTRSVEGVCTRPAIIPILSAVSGQPTVEGDFSPIYWAQNIRQPVLFAACIDQLIQSGHRTFIEISPHPVLAASISACLCWRDEPGTILHSLRRGLPEISTMYETLGILYRRGRSVNWKNIYAEDGRVVSLPAYPWNKKRFWIKPKKKYSAGIPHKAELSLRPLLPTEGQWGEAAEEAHSFYEIQWTPAEPVEGDSGSPAAVGSAWLIFSQNGDLASHVSEHLRQFGCRIIWVEPGESFGRSKADLFKIRPEMYEDYRSVIAAVSADHGFLARGAIYLNGLDQAPHEGISPDQLSRVACEICIGATHLARALSEDGQIQGDPRLWIVTMGGQPVDGRCPVAALGQSTLWGLGRAISLERASIWGGMVDLDPDEPSSLAARRLAHEIMHAGQEDQIGYRRGLRFVPRLARADTRQNSPNPVIFQKNSTYLVTGGLGSLGLAVARWMVEKGACSLVLLGRTGLDENGDSNHRGFKIRGVERLRSLGAEVDVEAQNVCDEAAMESLFARYRDLGRPIRGIVHAAGVISERAIDKLGERDFEAVFQAKIGGTWALHRVSQNGDIDFLILFSSASAILGGKDLTHYAAANAFLDAMAYYRRSRGFPALSVNWGLWADGNASAKIVRYFERIGLKSMANQTAFAALAILLGMRAVQVMCGEFEWNRFLPIYEAKRRRPLLSQFAEEGSSIALKASLETERVQKTLINASPIERRSHLLSLVRKVVAELLGFAEADLSDSRTGFFQMGMDSIMAVELQKQLEIDLRCTLTPTVAFEHPTIGTLTDHLEAVVFGKAEVIESPRVDRPPSPAPTPKKETAQLSEGELLDLLAKKLQQR